MPLTPFPRGPMPKNVQRWDEGPPFGRLMLDAEWSRAEGEIVLDRHTGERFRIERADCGFGCQCAAEATWVSDE